MIPVSKVVTEIVGQEKRINENAVEVPARNYGKASKTIDPIVRALQGNPKLSTIEKLVKAAGCKLVKPYGFILENSGKVVTISQVINYYGINTTGSVRCPQPDCNEMLTWDLILYHLEEKYQSGHKLKPSKVANLFSRKWYNWDYHNGSFWDAGEKIEEIH